MKKGGDGKKPEATPVSKTAFEAEMFVMPEGYRHGKVAPTVEPKKVQPTQTPIVQPAKKPPVHPLVKKGMSKGAKAFIVADIIIIIGVGIAGYIYLRSRPVPTPVVTETPIATPPPRQIEEPLEKIEDPDTSNTDVTSPFAKLVPGVDSDSDGLSDIEEQIVYGTNPSLPDTDGDGFLDGNEVFHRYNPAGTAPGELLESGLAKNYFADFFSIYYPATWTAGVVTQENLKGFTSTASFVDAEGNVVPSYASTAVFAAPTGEKISMSVSAINALPNQLEQSWREAFITNTLLSTTSKTGLRVLLTQDKLNAMIVLSDRVLVFVYDPGLKTTIDYQQTFQMMFNSIKLLNGEEV